LEKDIGIREVGGGKGTKGHGRRRELERTREGGGKSSDSFRPKETGSHYEMKESKKKGKKVNSNL